MHATTSRNFAWTMDIIINVNVPHPFLRGRECRCSNSSSVLRDRSLLLRTLR